MLTLFIRAIILYLLTLTTLRAMGKHQLGEFQPYEFALALMIANLMATPIADVSTPLLHGILPVAALFIVHSAITLLCLRFDGFKAVISGKPSLVASRGVVDKAELERLCMSVGDLLEGMRESGILDPAELGTAVVEADGSISAFPDASRRPVNLGVMRIASDYEGMPMVVVQDGRVQKHNLAMSGMQEAELIKALKTYNLRVQDALLCSLNTKGMLHVQDMLGGIHDLRAMEKEEVRW